jgi:hypothetical protein
MDDFELLPDPSSAYHDQKQSDGDWSSTNSTEGGFALDQAPNYTKIYIRKSAPTSGLSLADQGFTAASILPSTPRLTPPIRLATMRRLQA